MVSNGNSIKKVKVNLDPKSVQSFRRSETKIKHELNLFKVKRIICLQNKKDLAL